MKVNSEYFNSYEDVIEWLFVQLPNYQSQGTTAYKPGLDNIKTLLNAIDNPQNKFKSIHLAGTNGKGSTAHMLASIYQEEGYKVGIFSSPHIMDFRERVKINGELISQKQVLDFINQTKTVIDAIGATFFEITTALAFHICAEEKVDIAIIETGLGGRLDSTNVLNPLCSIITTIGLDHTQFLGDTIEEIAREKAGIIKKNTPVVIGKIGPTALMEIKKIALELDSTVIPASTSNFKTDLLGDYQIENLAMAVEAIRTLQAILPVSEDAIKNGLLNVGKNTRLMGRFQLIHENPKVIVDAAHNPDGIAVLFEQIKSLEYNQLHCIYGCSNDKSYQDIFSLFDTNAHYYFCEFDSARSTKNNEFELLTEQFNLDAKYFSNSLDAYRQALDSANSGDLILVFGSFYIMTELLG